MPFGKELQQEREKRGVTLEALALGTKVAVRFLAALESDDFDALPKGVFRRGILRSYCGFLGLDEQRWLTQLTAETASHGEETDWAEFAENVKRSRIKTDASMRPRWWGVLLLLFLLLGLGYTAWRFVIHPRLRLSLPAAPVACVRAVRATPAG